MALRASARPIGEAARALFSRGPSLSLWAVLAVPAAWYAYFLTFGPRVAISHDELNFLHEALRLPAEGRLSSYSHGPLLYELLAGLEAALYAALRFAGSVGSTQDFLVHVLANLPLHLTLGRAVTAAAGMLTVLQTYRLGRIVAGETAGVVAAALCLTNLTFFIMSSMCKEDALFWAFTLLAMELAWRSIEGPGPLRAVGAGVCIAAAFAAKYLALFAPLLALVPLARAWREDRRRGLRAALVMGVAALVGLFVFFPFLVTDFGAVLGSLREAHSASAATGTNWALSAYLGHHLPNLVGWPIMLAGGFELARRLRSDPAGPALLFIVPALQFLFVGLRTGYSMAHYAFPLALACFIMAGAAMEAAASRLGGWSAAVLVPLLAAAVILGDGAYLRGTLKYALLVTGPRTSELARDYMLANARPGECVAMNKGSVGENFRGPDLTPSNHSPATGPFSRARAAADEARTGPRFFLQIGNHSDLPADLRPGCEWLVVGRHGAISAVEMGLQPPPTIVPPGYEKRVTIAAFPEEHSAYAPHPTTLDYDELHRSSLKDVLRRRAMGLSFDIYRAVP